MLGVVLFGDVIRSRRDAPAATGWLRTLSTELNETYVASDRLAPFEFTQGDDGQAEALAMTLEADGTGAIYPVLYLRRDGKIDERAIDPDPLLRFDTPFVRDQVTTILAELDPIASGG